MLDACLIVYRLMMERTKVDGNEEGNEKMIKLRSDQEVSESLEHRTRGLGDPTGRGRGTTRGKRVRMVSDPLVGDFRWMVRWKKVCEEELMDFKDGKTLRQEVCLNEEQHFTCPFNPEREN